MRQNFPKGVQLVNQLEYAKSAGEFANCLIAFSKFCTNLEGPSPSDGRCNWNVSLADLIQDPECCSSRDVVSSLAILTAESCIVTFFGYKAGDWSRRMGLL